VRDVYELVACEEKCFGFERPSNILLLCGAIVTPNPFSVMEQTVGTVGNTALHIAAMTGDELQVSSLCDDGADPSAQNVDA
jgi:hypothetical protein